MTIFTTFPLCKQRWQWQIAFFALLNHLEVLKKAYEEIDRVINNIIVWVDSLLIRSFFFC